MVQLILDIHSSKDAELIRELLKKFKGVEVMSFTTPFSKKEMGQRISKGLEDADKGRVKPWKEVKGKL